MRNIKALINHRVSVIDQMVDVDDYTLLLTCLSTLDMLKEIVNEEEEGVKT